MTSASPPMVQTVEVGNSGSCTLPRSPCWANSVSVYQHPVRWQPPMPYSADTLSAHG